MNILIVGAGMYVTGRGGHGVGTILSALAQLSKEKPVDRVIIIATAESNRHVVFEAIERINNLLRTQLIVEYRCIDPFHLRTQILDLCKKERIDAAIVSTPDHIHFEPIKALIEAGVHSLVVKPFVPTTEEALELIKMQESSNTYGAIEFHKRFDESNLFAKRKIDEKSLGDLRYITIDYSQRIVIPTEVFAKWAHTTNVFQYLGVHYVDLIYFMTNFRPRALSAYGCSGTLKERGIDTFDSVHVMLEWEDPEMTSRRFVSQFNISWIDPNTSSAISDQKFKIVGSKGRLECDQKNRGIELVTDKSGVTHSNPYFAEYLPDADGKLSFTGYGYKSIQQFFSDVHAIKSGGISPADICDIRPSFRSALVSTAVIDTVNQALKDGPQWRMIYGLS